MENNRRVFKRVPTSFLLTFNLNARPVDAVAQDISEGGLCVFSPHELPEGSRLNLKFKIFNDAEPVESQQVRQLEVQGKVRYSILEDADYRMGIEFLNVPEADRRFIANFVETNP